MNAITALQRLRDQGVEVLPEGDNLRIVPRVPEGLRGDLVRLKEELIPMARILAALDLGPMRAHELVAATGVDLGALYQALGALYDAGLVKTDPEGWYYLPAQYTRPALADQCASCRSYEARGQRVLACSVCDVRAN